MVLVTTVVLILFYSFPSLNSLLNSVLFRRINAIAYLYASVLALNTLIGNIQLIGSGIGLYSGLFQVNLISNFFSFFILIISSIIIISWPNLIKNENLPLASAVLLDYPKHSRSGEGLTPFSPQALSINYIESKAPTVSSVKRFTYNYIKNDSKSNEYNLIVLFNILGALFLISSSDLVSMYLSIELQSFGLYILTTLYKEKYSSTSAGLKYFLLGGLSSCIILLGSGIIYTYTGLTNLESVYNLVSVYLDTISFQTINLSSIELAFSNETAFSAVPSNTYFLHESFSMFNSELRGISLGILLILSGFLFKIAASPFHNWAPDVYDDSPTLVTIWLTIIPKISILIFLLQLQITIIGGIGFNLNIFLPFTFSSIIAPIDLNLEELFNSSFLSLNKAGVSPLGLEESILTNLLLISSLLSLIIGAIVGLSQVRIKRLLAYSTINHIGFLLLALAIFSNSSIEAFIFYILQYTVTNLNIFLIILGLSYMYNITHDFTSGLLSETLRDNKKILNLEVSTYKPDLSLKSEEEKEIRFKVFASGTPEQPETIVAERGIIASGTASVINLSDIEYISSLKGLFYKNPLLTLSFSICLFSFAGVPPLIGFFAKQQVLYSSISAGYFFISLVAIIVSVISASYYLKIIKILNSKESLITTKREAAQVTPAFAGERKLSRISVAAFGAVKSNKINNPFTTVHSFLIGILTLIIVLFIFNPAIILNSIAIFISTFLNL